MIAISESLFYGLRISTEVKLECIYKNDVPYEKYVLCRIAVQVLSASPPPLNVYWTGFFSTH
jgi:hypothetical protein